jgi:trigger factor
VLQEAINGVLPGAYGAAVAEAGINPLGEPEIEVTKLEDGDLVEFTAEVDVRPEFEVPDFAKLSAKVDALPDIDKEVDERIELLRERFATASEVERGAKKGDQVVIDLIATQDGEQIPNGSSEGVTYVIGSGGMIDGLDEALKGLKAGKSKTFQTTLVGGEKEGEEADIEVTVQKVSQRELPEVDDEFASMVSEFDTVAEMRADLAKSVEDYAKAEQVSAGRNKILEQLVEKTDFELPEQLLAGEIETRKEQITDQLSRAGLTLERYLERLDGEAKTPDEFWAELEGNTVQGLKAQLILDKVADDEEVKVTQEDLAELLMRKAIENNTSPEEEAKHMMEHNHMGAWTQEIRRNKALESVVGKAKVTDSKGKKVNIARATLKIEQPAEAE